MKFNVDILRRAALVALLVLSLGVITSCTHSEEAVVDEAAQQMLDYYDKESVQNFHRDMQTSLNNVVKALDKEDEKGLTKALDSLTTLCDEFIQVTDVPEGLNDYHEKMSEAARDIKAFAKDIAEDDFVSASKKLESAQSLLNEAQELLPKSSS